MFIFTSFSSLSNTIGYNHITYWLNKKIVCVFIILSCLLIGKYIFIAYLNTKLQIQDPRHTNTFSFFLFSQNSIFDTAIGMANLNKKLLSMKCYIFVYFIPFSSILKMILLNIYGTFKLDFNLCLWSLIYLVSCK